MLQIYIRFVSNLTSADIIKAQRIFFLEFFEYIHSIKLRIENTKKKETDVETFLEL